jgi:hypothetical protein
VFPDQGLKAAAWWLRANAAPDALVFADAAYEPYQLSYYLHRPFLAATDAGPQEAFALLDEAERRPDFYLVTPGHEGLLRTHAGERPTLAATVVDGGRAVLLVYRDGPGAAETLEAAVANREFDRDYGGWRAMFGR